MAEPVTDEQPVKAVEETKVNGVEEPKDPQETQDPPPKVNGHTNTPSVDRKQSRAEADPDAQEMLIETLRTQIQDLFSQVTQLNGKLVKSYDRVSDLEDDLHTASSNIRTSTLKISELEMEKTQHLSALNTGLLVEKTHVTAELNRLMERATEEAAQRGQAEDARATIEKELDDLSANLFDQANNMVAEARFAKHKSEQKLSEAELALKGAEEAVSLMQQQMQSLQAEKEEADEKAQRALALMGKGKWVEQPEEERSITKAVRLLSSHAPYQEFLLFVSHLRGLHPTTPHAPAITTLLPLPFLARLLTEDSEPTIRLDLAPSLNWLSRRSVLSAIHTGQLIIEPMTSAALLHEILSSAASTTIPGLTSGGNQSVACALCGSDIFPPLPETDSGNATPTTVANSWATGLFKRSTSNSTPTTRSRLPSINSDQYPPQVYVFRLAPSSAPTAAIPVPPPQRNHGKEPSSSSTPHHSSNTSQILSNPASTQSTTLYPLCNGKWCLTRLRTTCTMWAFVRSGIVDKIWEEEVALPPPPPKIATSTSSEKPPPVPPRRRGLWGALTERAASWGGDADKNKAEAAAAAAATAKTASQGNKSGAGEESKVSVEENKTLPPPPPSHPSVPRTHSSTATEESVPRQQVHRVPPALPPRSEVRRQPSPIPPTSADENPAEEPKLASETDTPAAAAPPSSTTSAPQDEPPAPPAPTATSSTSSNPPLPALPARPPRRTMTPSNIPLPPSRPQTPTVGLAASPSSPKFPPGAGTGAGAAPPPLPRRAAARVPRAPHPDAPGGSRPGTPVQVVQVGGGSRPATPAGTKEPSANAAGAGTGVGVEEEGVTDVKVEKPVVEKSEEENKEEKEEVPPPAASNAEDKVAKEDTPERATDSEGTKKAEVRQEASEAVAAPQADAPTPSSDSEDLFVDASSVLPSQATTPAVQTDTPDQSEPEHQDAPVEAQADAGDNQATPKQPTPPSEKAAELDVSNASSDPSPARVLHEEPEAIPEPTEEEKAKSSDGDNHNQVYIGDTTWEERTWKEVVRLKEAMFWARIGGIRS